MRAGGGGRGERENTHTTHTVGIDAILPTPKTNIRYPVIKQNTRIIPEILRSSSIANDSARQGNLGLKALPLTPIEARLTLL